MWHTMKPIDRLVMLVMFLIPITVHAIAWFANK